MISDGNSLLADKRYDFWPKDLKQKITLREGVLRWGGMGRNSIVLIRIE
jgi:hypothetical protein